MDVGVAVAEYNKNKKFKKWGGGGGGGIVLGSTGI